MSKNNLNQSNWSLFFGVNKVLNISKCLCANTTSSPVFFFSFCALLNRYEWSSMGQLGVNGIIIIIISQCKYIPSD